jgi:hypothetical protein
MAAQKSPLSGYNHNLKYKDRVFHVQTEDSGRDNPHIFTHLFHDGTILNTLRSEYTEIVNAPDWEQQLRGRMQNQHKDMMKGLVKGSFDDKIVAFFGVLEAEVAEDLPMATLPPAPKRDRTRSRDQATAPTPPPAAQPPGQSPAQSPAQRPPSQAPWQVPATAPPAAAQRPAQDSGGVVIAMPMIIVGGQPPAPPPAAHQAPPTAGAAFAAAPAEAKNVPDSIFGSELISEKSLDEVILAYLSEDMTEE